MQYYVVKEDVDVLAAKLGTTAEALSKKVFPTRITLRNLLLHGDPQEIIWNFKILLICFMLPMHTSLL